MRLNSILRRNSVSHDLALCLPNFLFLAYVPHHQFNVLLRAYSRRECLICGFLEYFLLPERHRVQHRLHFLCLGTCGRCNSLLLMKLVDKPLNEVALVGLTAHTHAHRDRLCGLPWEGGSRTLQVWTVNYIRVLTLQNSLGWSHIWSGDQGPVSRGAYTVQDLEGTLGSCR